MKTPLAIGAALVAFVFGSPPAHAAQAEPSFSRSPSRATTGAAPRSLNQRRARGPVLSIQDADRLEAIADVLEQQRQRGRGAARASAKKIRWLRGVAADIRHERFLERRAA